MSFAVGLKALRRLCQEQDTLAWQKAKLSGKLFKPQEQVVYEWIALHLKMQHVLPQLDTLSAMFPDVAAIETPEPSSYYAAMLENRYFYEVISKANITSQQILKEDQNAYQQSIDVLRDAVSEVLLQKHRFKILNVGEEGGLLVLEAYHAVNMEDGGGAILGWPYLDEQAGKLLPGEIVSIIGRPSVGKSWQMLWMALQNWKAKSNILFVSMEMMSLPITQRIISMYTHSNISQLKKSGFATLPPLTSTYDKFKASLKGLVAEEGKFYVVDGNLAVSAEDIYALADTLQCKKVMIDGGYLLPHKKKNLDRFARTAENVELIKRYTTDMNGYSFVSWQFSRKASEKQGKSKGQNSEDVGLEDIGYSDAIGQISSIVLGLFEEDSVETMKRRKVRILKGRNGEIGQFFIAWDFQNMFFGQLDPPINGGEPEEPSSLKPQWV